MFVEVILALSVGLITAAAFCLFRRMNNRRFHTQTNCDNVTPIPGWNDPPADPVLGDLGIARAAGSIHDYLFQKHEGGRCPVTSFWWRDHHVVSVCSARAYKDVENMTDKPKQLFAPFTEPLHGCNSIQSVNGVEWKERKKLHLNIRGRNLESFFSDLVQIAQETVKLWSETPGKPIRLTKEMFRTILKAILVTSLGNIFEGNDEIEKLAEVYDTCKREMNNRILEVSPYANSQKEMKFQEKFTELQDYFMIMIEARKKQREGGQKSKKLPLMDALFDLNCPQDQLIADITTYMGGFHTAAFYATWTFYYLARHRSVQERLFMEVRDRAGGDFGEKLKAYTLTANSFLRQVLDESLRLSVTASFDGHCSDQDTVVEGYRIPANTPIIHAIGVTLNDENTWENAGSFDPDRFSPGSKHANRSYEFRPFGIPPVRRCPANRFIYFVVSVCIAVVVQKFEILTVNEGKDPLMDYGIATAPKEEIYIRVALRGKD